MTIRRLIQAHEHRGPSSVVDDNRDPASEGQQSGPVELSLDVNQGAMEGLGEREEAEEDEYEEEEEEEVEETMMDSSTV